jgi:putative protease
MPTKPKSLPVSGEPAMIFQVLTEDQLTEELAALKPRLLYAPMTLMQEHFDKLRPFIENGTTPVAVLPRVITDTEMPAVYEIVSKLFDQGINEALIGNLGHAMLAKQAGMHLRGDFALNAFNSLTMEMIKNAGFLSATASFELRLSQIKDLSKTLDTELIVYGRLPLMVSDQCIIRHSAGRCACQTPGQMADRMGSIFPVVKEFGCRNVIYNAHKLYLADKANDIYEAGLWGLRMMFTTESPRECVEVAKGYMGISDYKPNVLTRGLYYRGVD